MLQDCSSLNKLLHSDNRPTSRLYMIAFLSHIKFVRDSKHHYDMAYVLDFLAQFTN